MLIQYTTLCIAAECYLLLAFISQHAALFVFTTSSDAAPVVSSTKLCGSTDCVSCSFLPVITKSNVIHRCAASDGESQGGIPDYHYHYRIHLHLPPVTYAIGISSVAV